MEEKRFDPQKLDKLNKPSRIKEFSLDLIIEQTGLLNPKTIVDIGAGTGFYSIPFAVRYPKSKIYALDISDVMIIWMKENIVPKHDNIVPVKMEDNQTNLQDASADLVFMVNLHHELDKPDLMLKEAYRILKDNGFIAISDWRKENTNKGPSYHLRYDTKQVKLQLSNSGFKNIKIYKNFPNNFLIIGGK